MKFCLVVNDSKVVRSVARNILEELGFAFDDAEDGKVALQACNQTMPDVMLPDWNIPVMNGIGFLRELRLRDDGGRPVVVLFTNENDVNFIQEAIVAGANEYIMKPYDRDIVQSKFAQAGIL